MVLRQRVAFAITTMATITTGILLGGAPRLQAADVRITLPKRSHTTPVQKLNREGVEEVRKHRYEKAEGLFYKAYLLDSDDPFTLNNLGYVSELQGQVDRAQRFYELAAQQPTEALIDRASSKSVEGRSVAEALAIPTGPLKLDHENVEAVRLLSKGRAPEADLLLQQSLKSDPQNVFTLNNMGVAKEMEGESQEALKYYDVAAASHSDATAIVTLNRSWRGKQATAMAAQNAKKLRSRLAKQQNIDVELAELNLRGVSAINRNDLSAADRDFRSAYALDPDNAFALNNMGYLSEIQGDPETAQVFYDKAKAVRGANTTVALATRRSAEGLKLGQVASESDTKVGTKVLQDQQARRQQPEPIQLRRRDNSLVEEPAAAPANSSQPQQNLPPQ
jgi:Flp pilus assembly protein TadD